MSDSQNRKYRKGRVLLFNDDESTATAVSHLLAERGFTIERASPDADNLSAIKNDLPELIVTCAASPPFVSGELMKHINDQEMNVPVIVMGDGDGDTVISAFRSGAADYLSVPVDVNELYERIDAVLAGTRNRRIAGEHAEMDTLLQSMERDRKTLSDLLKISTTYNVSGDSKEILNRLTDLAAESMNCEAASIMMINEREQTLEFVVATGEKKQRLDTISIPVTEGIAGWVATHGKPQIVNDTATDERFTGSVDKESGFVTRQILAVPLFLEQDIIGVLEVINTCDRRELGEKDAGMLIEIGQRAASLIETTRTIEHQQNFYVQTTNILVNAIEKKDMFSQGHSWKVAELCHKIAAEINLPETDRNDLHFGALLHDIGKLDMASSLFNKRRITDRELAYIRQHPVKGAKLLEPISIWKAVVPLVLYHHESYDGSGYPFGRSGEDIPLGSRIIHLAEAFTVMRAPNSYKKQMSLKETVLEIMRLSGKQFDPEIVKALITVLQKDNQR